MTDDLTGKRVDRLVIDDPHADLIARTPITDRLPPRPLGFDTGPGPDRTSIALVVSEGSPLAPQIGRLLAAHGLGDRLVVMPTPDPAQLADLFEPMHARIAKAFTVPPDLLFESSPCVSHALIEQRARRLSAQIDEALLSGRGFPTAMDAVRQMAMAREWNGPARSRYDRLLARAYAAEAPARLSKRRRRRLRGRAKEARRC